MSITATKIRSKSVGEHRNVSVSFLNKLDFGESLIGTPIITELTTSDLTFTDESINTIIIRIEDMAHNPGEAVVFNVAGGIAGTTYIIQIECDTDSAITQTLRGRIRLYVEED